MGAWNTGIFDDDEAYEVLSCMKKEADVEGFMQRELSGIGSGDADYSTAFVFLVYGAVVDTARNGTTYRCDDDDYLEWATAVRLSSDVALTRQIVRGLERVLESGSELRALWEENAELFPQWKKNVEDLTLRLKATL